MLPPKITPKNFNPLSDYQQKYGKYPVPNMVMPGQIHALLKTIRSHQTS